MGVDPDPPHVETRVEDLKWDQLLHVEKTCNNMKGHSQSLGCLSGAPTNVEASKWFLLTP